MKDLSLIFGGIFKDVALRFYQNDPSKKRIKNYYKVLFRMYKIKIKNNNIGKKQLSLVVSFITLGGSGFFKRGPGTLASIVTVLIWYVLLYLVNIFDVGYYFIYLFFSLICFVVTILSISTIPIYLIYKKLENEVDHKSIVIDEFVGQVISLTITFYVFRYYYDVDNAISGMMITIHLLMSFVMFRIFDIAKPWLIGYCDRNFKSPFGVMLDDILAGFFAGFTNLALYHLFSTMLVV